MKETWDHKFPLLEGDPGKDKVTLIKIDEIEPNPYQPRRTFSPDKIRELTQSIKTYGLLQPVIVRRAGRGYELVVGERRLMACKSLGWKQIAAVVKEISDSAMATIALIENLQRENLNFIEEAAGYARLMESFNLTQEVLAQRLGKSQSTIANKLRLLRLPESVKQMVLNENLTERHARALLKLNSENLQRKMALEIVERGLTVNQTEQKIDRLIGPEKSAVPDRRQRSVIKDIRIFLNTIREAVKMIESAGLSPEVEEKNEPGYIQVTIRLTKQ